MFTQHISSSNFQIIKSSNWIHRKLVNWLKKVRKIEIKTRGLSTQVFSGGITVLLKEEGWLLVKFVNINQVMISFYRLECNSAIQLPVCKVFEEEREMTVMLLVDVSASGNSGHKNNWTGCYHGIMCCTCLLFYSKQWQKSESYFFTDKIENLFRQKKEKAMYRIIRDCP